MIIYAHAHLWKKQNGIVNGKPVFDVGGGKSNFGGEIKKSQGISEDDIIKMATTAICKINMDTDLRLAHTAGVRKDLAENPGHFDQRDYNKAGKANVKEQVAHAIELVEGV